MPDGTVTMVLCPALGLDWKALDLTGFLQSRANQTGTRRHLFWFVFIALAWTPWTTFNKMVIKRVLLRRASKSIFKFLAFLQHWHLLSGQRDHDQLGRMMDSMTAAARRLASPQRS